MQVLTQSHFLLQAVVLPCDCRWAHGDRSESFTAEVFVVYIISYFFKILHVSSKEIIIRTVILNYRTSNGTQAIVPWDHLVPEKFKFSKFFWI
jgi:hypothetical protein